MRGLLPFDGFFGDTALDHFFSDAPAAYKDYVSVPKVDIEDKKDFYEITCDRPFSSLYQPAHSFLYGTRNMGNSCHNSSKLLSSSLFPIYSSFHFPPAYYKQL